MKQTKVNITSEHWIILEQFEGFNSSLCLECEDSNPQPYQSSGDFSIDIDECKAKEIIDLLHVAYPSLKEHS